MTTYTALDAPLASPGNRLVGQFADGIIGGAPFFIAFWFAGASPTLGMILIGLAAVWSCFYYLFADGFPGGQSYAKRWLSMQVVDAKTGAPCSWGQSFIRNLLLAILGPIDWIFIFGEKHQRLGDNAAGTIVITD